VVCVPICRMAICFRRHGFVAFLEILPFADCVSEPSADCVSFLCRFCLLLPDVGFENIAHFHLISTRRDILYHKMRIICGKFLKIFEGCIREALEGIEWGCLRGA
jgi:hypothetical protein